MSYQAQYERWLHSPALSQPEKDELAALSHNAGEIEDRFFSLLQFGTAGLRGVMGVGLRRMNVHVIRHATQAFAQVILEEGAEAAKRGVAICYDCRVHSQEFARAAAEVMAGNGIPVRLFEAMRGAGFGDEQKAREFDRLMGAEILLIDDLGTEPMVRNITVEYLFSLINERTGGGMHTVIATNLSFEDLKNRYTERISSRLLDKNGFEVVGLAGEDLRLIGRRRS